MPLERCVLTSSVPFQYRLARSVDKGILRIIRFVCESDPTVKACYLLEVRRPNDTDVRLGIALLADGPIENPIDRFVATFREYPETDRQIIIFCADPIASDLAGHEYYQRSARSE